MIAFFLLAGCGFATQPSAIEAPESASTPLEVFAELHKTNGQLTGEGAPVPLGDSLLTGSTEPNVVETVCELIYQGKFDTAGERIKQFSQDQNPQLGQLAKIVQEYQAISQRRQSAREAAYQQQLAELEKFRAAADANDVNEANDVNDIPKVLSVVAKACEFADEQQKEQLLSESFVEQVFQKAKAKAAEFEAKGKWLDAYINCYSWLQAIDKDNEAYSDYAEQLLEKAGIVASFQDSPCETRKERYEGVKKQMFIRAIDTLNFNYVSIIDYGQMATEAIKRCELLVEVIGLSFSQNSQNKTAVSQETPGNKHPAKPPELSSGEDSEAAFLPLPLDSKKLTAWSAALAAVLDEVNQSPTGISKDKFIDIFEKVLALNTTIVQLPHPVLIAQFAEAALSALDPYTVMVWPKQAQDFEKIMTNEFTGIGIEISKQKGLLTVASLLPDTPAYNSGLDAGDVIEAVDEVQTKDMTLICAVHRITGPAGTKVTLTIRRAGEDETRDITITRAKITVPTIRGWQRTKTGKWLYMIDERNKIGYVRITSFSERTAPDLEKVLGQLEAEGLKGLILDLRFNSGGLLDSAATVADKFLEEGPIVITRPRRWVSSTYALAHKEKTHPDYPLVVLINSSSASASEIVAGAFADATHRRAILVGERTHGKGSVQGITHYPGGGAQLKYTMAYYHLPSGQRVESRDAMKKRGRKDWGVGPNIEVKLRRDELKKMIDVQRDNDVLVKPALSAAEGAGHDNDTTPLKKHIRHGRKETLAADPQLAVGVLVVKSKLIQAGPLVSSVN